MVSEIDQRIYFIPAFNAAACGLLSSYTFISILDHERWMKEWGDDHEAEAVMHLRTPILSAAVAMGIGGITTVHQVALASLRLSDETHLGASVLCTCLAAVTAIATMFAMLYVARMDSFAGVDRVECLKEAVLKKHTISELKLKKGLGKRVAYMGKLHHVVAAGTILATGIMGCWALNVLGLTGDFAVVLRTSGVVYLAVYVLGTSIVSSWLLFRVLVWKPSHEYLRPLCSAFFALSLWSADYIGKTVAITFDYAEDGLEKGVYAWSLEASSSGGEWLMIMMALGAVLTQYAIALELRLAYCGLQDANLDLQILTGTGAPEKHTRKSSALHNSTRKRQNTGGGRRGSSRSAPARPRRRSVVVHATTSSPGSPMSPGSSIGSPMSPGSPSASLYRSRAFSAAGAGDGDGGSKHTTQIKTSASVLSAVLRMGSESMIGGMSKKKSQSQQPRSIRVQPVAAKLHNRVLVYEPSVAEDSDEEKHPPSHLPLPTSGHPPTTPTLPVSPFDSSAGWHVVRPTNGGKGGTVYEVGPLKKFDSPDSAV